MLLSISCTHRWFEFFILFFLFNFIIVIIIIVIVIIIIIIIIIILMWRLCRHELVYAGMGWIIQILVGF